MCRRRRRRAGSSNCRRCRSGFRGSCTPQPVGSVERCWSIRAAAGATGNCRGGRRGIPWSIYRGIRAWIGQDRCQCGSRDANPNSLRGEASGAVDHANRNDDQGVDGRSDHEHADRDPARQGRAAGAADLGRRVRGERDRAADRERHAAAADDARPPQQRHSRPARRHPEDRRVGPQGEHLLRADLSVDRRGSHGHRRAAERRHRPGAARAGADLRRRQGHRQRQVRGPGAGAAATPSGCRSGSRISTRTRWANTRCKPSGRPGRPRYSGQGRIIVDSPALRSLQWRHRVLRAVTPSSSDDRRHREPEGRRRQDHHRDQPGRGAVAARQADPPHRSRSPGQQLDVVPGRDAARAQRLRRGHRAGLRLRGRHRAVDAAQSLGRAVAHRARQARIEAGGGARRAFPAEGPASADPGGTIRTSSSTARRRSAC